jgi:YHS domain-containing protein
MERRPGVSSRTDRSAQRTGRVWKLSLTLIVLLLCAAVVVIWYAGKQKESHPQATRVPSASSPVPSGGLPLMLDVKGESGKPQSVDVISGKPVSPSVYADYEGYRVYFCCATSRSDFQQNAQGYLQAMKLRGILLVPTPAPGKSGNLQSGSAQSSPAIEGRPSKPRSASLDRPKAVSSVNVPLNAGVKTQPKKPQSTNLGTLEAAPSVGVPLLVDAKGEPGKLQSVDVISGKPVNPSVYADYDGKRVYFCCAVSRDDFQQNARSYLQAIEMKGILLEKVSSP